MCLRLRTIAVTDYGEENPLYFDYYGCPPYFYNIKFKSRGDSNLANRIAGLYNKVCGPDLPQVVTSLTRISRKAGMTARIAQVSEPRGVDGLGKRSPGLDHGVFIPFREMFGEETDIPIVQVSIDSSFDPEGEWKIGQVLDELRYARARDSVRRDR